VLRLDSNSQLLGRNSADWNCAEDAALMQVESPVANAISPT
jgi:hypothetical protein